MKVCLSILRGSFNTGVILYFMVCCTLESIKETTKIQVDTFTFLFFCFLFCVYYMGFISMVIVKEIIFIYVIYFMTVCRTDQKQ